MFAAYSSTMRRMFVNRSPNPGWRELHHGESSSTSRLRQLLADYSWNCLRLFGFNKLCQTCRRVVADRVNFSWYGRRHSAKVPDEIFFFFFAASSKKKKKSNISLTVSPRQHTEKKKTFLDHSQTIYDSIKTVPRSPDSALFEWSCVISPIVFLGVTET